MSAIALFHRPLTVHLFHLFQDKKWEFKCYRLRCERQIHSLGLFYSDNKKNQVRVLLVPSTRFKIGFHGQIMLFICDYNWFLTLI